MADGTIDAVSDHLKSFAKALEEATGAVGKGSGLSNVTQFLQADLLGKFGMALDTIVSKFTSLGSTLDAIDTATGKTANLNAAFAAQTGGRNLPEAYLRNYEGRVEQVETWRNEGARYASNLFMGRGTGAVIDAASKAYGQALSSVGMNPIGNNLNTLGVDGSEMGQFPTMLGSDRRDDFEINRRLVNQWHPIPSFYRFMTPLGSTR